MTATENRGPQVYAVTWAMWAITVPAILLRTWTRLHIMRSWGFDDWFMVLAMISFTINTWLVSSAATYGIGRHSWDLSLEDQSLTLHYWLFCYLTYCTTMILSKTSIAGLLLRITPNKIHRIIIYISLSLTVICGIAFFFMALFQCWPVSYFWNRIPDAGTCVSIDVIIAFTYTYSAFSIITDFSFTVLPIWMVWHLQTDLRTKIALVPILSMGAVASCAVVVRLAYVEDFRGNDFLWSISDIAIWSQTEEGLAIAAGCLATLQPLFRQIVVKLGLTNIGSPSNSASPAVPISIRTIGQSAQSKVSKIRSRQRPHTLYDLTTFTRMEEDKTYSREELTPSEPQRSGTGFSQSDTLEVGNVSFQDGLANNEVQYEDISGGLEAKKVHEI